MIKADGCRIGIDLGGTKIEILVIDRHGHEIFRRRVKTPRGDYEGTVKAIRDLVFSAESELTCEGRIKVGVATPGSISPASGLMQNSNSTWLMGHRMDKDLIEILGRPVRMENDANCFALSEAVDGAAAGSRNMFGVILGTGVGAGVVINGQVIEGCNGIAGEWGHNSLPWPKADPHWGEIPGPPCYCGKNGCVEQYLCGPALERQYHKKTSRSAPAAEIAKLEERGDPAAVETLREFEDRLARGLSMVINVIDPEVIVLGGGVSNIACLYANVPKLWSKTVFSTNVATRLVPAKHGDSSGVRGAAWLWGRPDSE